MESWKILHDMVHRTVREMGRKNVTAEAFFTAFETTEISIRNSQILTQNKIYDAGVGIRVEVDNKVGFACTNTAAPDIILKTAEKALSIARVSSKNPDFALPSSDPGKLPEVRQLYDSRVGETPVEEAVKKAQRAVSAAEDVDPRVKIKSGLVLFQSGWRGIATTLGVDCAEPESRALIYLGGIGEYNHKVTGICSHAVYSRTAEVDPYKVGVSTGEKVCSTFNPESIASFEGTAIFGPKAGSNQLVEVLADGLSGNAVKGGRSVWAHHLGEAVASPCFTVMDDGLLENGFSSRQFDDEGHPSQNTVLIEKGKLRGFMHDACSARALEMDNTGNASRSPGGFDMINSIIGTGYRREPEIYPSNMVVAPGTKTREDLISEVDRGVFIESMAGFPQKGSGVISAQLSQAFFIKNGEIQYPIKEGMVSGAGFSWFKNISGVGNDAEKFQNAVIPSLRVEGVTVVGDS